MQTFAPTPSDTRAAVEASRARWSQLERTPPEVSLPELHAAHARFVAVARELAGTTRDAHKRAVVYFSVYEDSGGNFLFPMIASHGSLWGVRHTVRLEWALGGLERFSRGRVRRWLDALDAVRDINRRVFVEIYSTFYFTRFYGQHPQADQVIKPAILALYNRSHAATKAGELLPYAERRALYYDVFVHEQHDIVDPGIQQAAGACPQWLVAGFKRVSPRFAYFPRAERLWFTDFTSVDQRNREGLRACDFAEEVGSDRVLAAMAEY